MLIKDMRIAITGGIGSGKSYVCKRLENYGLQVYDCDAAAKRLMRTSPELQKQLSELVGEDVYINKVLNKAALAKYLLESESHAKAIDNIVHPAVAADFLSSGLSWMECAILFESGFDKYVDRIICVTAPLEIRIQRVMNRDGITRSKVLEWMSQQMTQEEKVARSHFEIINDGVSDIDKQIEKILGIIKITN
jgi:dephospho-CoA kinase